MSGFYQKFDCIVIGGGIFGLYAASLMSNKGARVAVLEKESSIFSRASKVNQSRVHRGYHYPRSLETGRKVSAYYERFCSDFDFSLIKGFKQYYAVSSEDSKVTPNEYFQYCKTLGIPLKEVDSSQFFNPDKVTVTFETDEACFNHSKIKDYYLNKFRNLNGVKIFNNTHTVSAETKGNDYVVSLNNSSEQLIAPVIINATYSGVNEVNKIFGFSGYDIKYELCELVLCQANNGFSQTGLTVVDGPFLSLMPFEDGSNFTLSSVSHTPLQTNYNGPQTFEYDNLRRIKSEAAKNSNAKSMALLAQEYFNKNISLEYGNSLFEIKPILVASEEDDSRPTVITTHSRAPYFISILSGKISSIYDLDKVLGSLK